MELIEFSNRTMMLLGGLFWVAVILWVWALIDIIRLSRNSTESPAPWLILIILFPIIGSILFFQIGKKRMKESKRSFDPKFNRN